MKFYKKKGKAFKNLTNLIISRENISKNLNIANSQLDKKII